MTQSILPYGLQKFKRYAITVWEVDATGKTDEAVALEGLDCMRTYMEKLGLVMNIKELGVTEDMLEGIVKGIPIMQGGYKVLSGEEIMSVLKESM